MTDFLYSVFANYGVTAIQWGAVVLFGLLARLVWRWTKNQWVRDTVSRALAEVQTAVLEVAQTYADRLRDGRKDGKLTAGEKAAAKDMAIAAAKSYIGTKGLKALARALNLDAVEDWLAGKIEREVRLLKPVAANPPAASAE